MEKDIISIIKLDNTSEDMEVVATFVLKETNKKYLVYKSLNNDEYYCASYEDENFSDLNVDFTEEEKKLLNRVFKTIISGGNKNA